MNGKKAPKGSKEFGAHGTSHPKPKSLSSKLLPEAEECSSRVILGYTGIRKGYNIGVILG